MNEMFLSVAERKKLQKQRQQVEAEAKAKAEEEQRQREAAEAAAKEAKEAQKREAEAAKRAAQEQGKARGSGAEGGGEGSAAAPVIDLSGSDAAKAVPVNPFFRVRKRADPPAGERSLPVYGHVWIKLTLHVGASYPHAGDVVRK